MAVPVVVVLSLLLVALIMTPAIVALVGARRFPQLDKRHGGGLASSIAWSIGCTLLALVALVVSVPIVIVTSRHYRRRGILTNRPLFRFDGACRCVAPGIGEA